MQVGDVVLRGLGSRLGSVLGSGLPRRVLFGLVARACERDPQIVLDAFGPRLNRTPNLDAMSFDLPSTDGWRFEHLAGLFASTALDHAVISMTIRQAAYLFGLVRDMKARKILEIGRYKGGSTLLIAFAMEGEGTLWSIDMGLKETQLYPGTSSRLFDEQLRDLLRRLGLKNVEILVGDSRTVDVDTGEADLVFIDGDHSYEGVKNDFERFGRRVHVGGAVLFDDAFDEGLFKTHSQTVGRVVREIIAQGNFRLVRAVNRMAHLERIR